MRGAPDADGAVRLLRFPVAVARGLVRGDLERPADWHPEFPTVDTLGAARMLLGTYEALGTEPAGTPWWFFGIVVDELVVGDAGFHGPPPDDGPAEVEIGYEVVPTHRRRGIATRACALLLEHAWRHGAELVRAEVEPGAYAPASVAVLRANGFQESGDGGFVLARPARAEA